MSASIKTEHLEAMDFSNLEPVAIPVTIAGKQYVLREAPESAVVKYQNAIFKITKVGTDGKPTSLEGLADLEPLLVSLCLFKIEGDKETPVSIATIGSMSPRIVKPLFQRAKIISGLGATETPKQLENSELGESSIVGGAI